MENIFQFINYNILSNAIGIIIYLSVMVAFICIGSYFYHHDKFALRLNTLVPALSILVIFFMGMSLVLSMIITSKPINEWHDAKSSYIGKKIGAKLVKTKNIEIGSNDIVHINYPLYSYSSSSLTFVDSDGQYKQQMLPANITYKVIPKDTEKRVVLQAKTYKVNVSEDTALNYVDGMSGASNKTKTTAYYHNHKITAITKATIYLSKSDYQKNVSNDN